jgi:D-arginine dehydrogenase
VRIVVVGGGIAGISAAYELVEHHQVVVLEQERVLAYHTTGRSAALFTENYGDGTVRPLTTASRSFFDSPPAGFADHPLLTSRGTLTIARPDQLAAAEQLFEAGLSRRGAVELTDPNAAVSMCPVLRGGHLAAAVWEPDASDIDVAALHQGFVRGVRRRGGDIRASAELTAAAWSNGAWQVRAGGERFTADIVVNAAGAWADVVAHRSGIDPIGFVPRRRTAFVVAAPDGAAEWPMIIDADEAFYFKPDGGQLLCSPGDETPSEPIDARPEEIDVAMAIERINEATTLQLRNVRSQWAGLRTFAPDRAMVIGDDPDTPSFIWLAGQGGTGIQSAPAAARFVASIVADHEPPNDILAAGLDLEGVSPSRFRDPHPSR